MHTSSRALVLTPELVERFHVRMREGLSSGEVPFRNAYIASLLDRIEVDHYEVRLVGRKDVLEQRVMADGANAVSVRSFARYWRSRQGSNLRPSV